MVGAASWRATQGDHPRRSPNGGARGGGGPSRMWWRRAMLAPVGDARAEDGLVLQSPPFAGADWADTAHDRQSWRESEAEFVMWCTAQ